MATQKAHTSMLESAIESELAANKAQADAVFGAAEKRYADKRKKAEEEWRRIVEEARREGYGILPSAGGGYSESSPSRQTLAATLTSEERATLERLHLRARRLRQVKKFFEDDPELMHIVDQTIGNQVMAAEQRQQERARIAQRRQAMLSVTFAMLSLIAGWLLSAVSPVSAVARLVGH